MTLLLYTVALASAATFVAAAAARAVTYARSPLHLRWELYPVPHEAPARVAHGGSYFEESEWWTAPRRFNLAGELRVMLPEMLFLQSLREQNRPLWYRSFPFHFGLYLLAGSLVLFVLAALHAAFHGALGALGGAVHAAARVVGVAGLGLALAGACALLHRRLTDPSVRPYTVPGDIFNLVFFIVALGLTAIGCLAAPSESAGVLAVVSGLLSWNTALEVPRVLAGGLLATALLVAYIPLTHMSHFVAKYFTYHAVRWDDAPAGSDRAMLAKLTEYLTYRPTWSAEHLRADQPRTWAEIAVSNPPAESKR